MSSGWVLVEFIFSSQALGCTGLILILNNIRYNKKLQLFWSFLPFHSSLHLLNLFSPLVSAYSFIIIYYKIVRNFSFPRTFLGLCVEKNMLFLLCNMLSPGVDRRYKDLFTVIVVKKILRKTGHSNHYMIYLILSEGKLCIYFSLS